MGKREPFPCPDHRGTTIPADNRTVIQAESSTPNYHAKD
jgi:hypothetical protein